MRQIEPSSRHERLPVTDGRSAEARFIRRVTTELLAQCGNAPSASQRLLIDSIAQLSLRINLLDNDLSARDTGEYVRATATLAQLLAQLDAQPSAARSSIMSANSHCEAA
jgi:hypothetical protein